MSTSTATPRIIADLTELGRSVVALSPGYYELRIDGRYAGKRVEGTEQDAWDAHWQMICALGVAS